jgi:formylmethanofuran dehydrogenase subunit E
MDPTYTDIITFHGHSCPGLAIGYRMTKAGLAFLTGSRSADEELVAIVENDACGVDALQMLSGCTFGKGNTSSSKTMASMSIRCMIAKPKGVCVWSSMIAGSPKV